MHLEGCAFHGVDFFEGDWVPVELHIWQALIMLFPVSLPNPVVQAQLTSHCRQVSSFAQPCFHISFGWRGRIGQSCWVKVPWIILILLAILPDSMLSKILGVLYFSLLSHFSRFFSYFCCSLTVLPTAAFHHQVCSCRQCVLVNLHTFPTAFSKLDFSLPHIYSAPLSIAMLKDISVIKAFWFSDLSSGSMRRQVLRWGTNFF